MTLYRALETGLDEDLHLFCLFLNKQGIAHRVFEDGGRQVLAVGTDAHVAPVREAYRRWRSGEITLELKRQPQPARPSLASRVVGALLQQPVTVLAILLSVGGFAVVHFEWMRALHWLSFSAFRVAGNAFVFEAASRAYARGEYWRLLSPVFLHFSVLHVTFNLLWYWELGRRLERVRGSIAALAVLLLTGAGGNILQYVADPGVMFGGMSGVIYGVLGYLWMWNRFGGRPAVALPPGVLPFMLVWLFICMSGFIDLLGFGAIANAAHAAGLVIGMLLGIGAALVSDRRPAGPDRPAV